jgi:acetyl esterase/lipase
LERNLQMSIQAKILKQSLRFMLSNWLNAENIKESRAAMEKLSSRMKLPPDVIRNPVNIDNVPGEWITLSEIQEDQVFLYLHGGGYIVGSVNTHRALVTRIIRAAGMRSLAIDYRLAPEHPFPAALEDATKAYRWLLAEGYPPEKIIIAGDSAGGGLTLATLVSLRDAGDPLPAGAVCLSPWTDLAGTGDSINTKVKADPFLTPDEDHKTARLYADGHDLKHPLISPLYANLNELPPLLIQVGSDEILLDDSICFVKRAQEMGVEVTLEVWDGMIHVFQAFAMILPEGRKAISGIGIFMRDCVENNNR